MASKRQDDPSPPSSDSGDSASGDGEWLDVEPDEEESLTFVSLFDAQTFPSAEAMLAHCREKHAFDLAATLRRLQLDFYGAIRLVNFVRQTVHKGEPVSADITPSHFSDEAYLKPVLENDALIFTLDEILDADGDNDESAAAAAAAAAAVEATSAPQASSSSTAPEPSLEARNKALEAELTALRDQYANYRLAVEQTLDRRWGTDAADTVGPSTVTQKKDNSDYYFESYAAHEIHETMLKDAVRTDAYRDFIYDNKQLFKDKVVLDIGCGTGILSMFAAKAGAKQVIAVDKSDIITKAIENIFHNGLASTITCLKGAIEDVVLPVAQVDVIVSEWMGYFLLYEAMLPSVLYARDKYLKPDGILAPSSCTMWIAPVADQAFVADHITYWRDVYGFDMKAMQEAIHDEARVEVMPKDSVCGSPYAFRVLDLYKVAVSDLVFTAKWQSTIHRDIDELDGFLIWFDNHFSPSRDQPLPDTAESNDAWIKKKQGNGVLPTGPFTTPTHWRQGLLLSNTENASQGLSKDTAISGEITYKTADDNVRALTLGAKWTVPGQKEKSQSWKMK